MPADGTAMRVRSANVSQGAAARAQTPGWPRTPRARRGGGGQWRSLLYRGKRASRLTRGGSRSEWLLEHEVSAPSMRPPCARGKPAQIHAPNVYLVSTQALCQPLSKAVPFHPIVARRKPQSSPSTQVPRPSRTPLAPETVQIVIKSHFEGGE